MSIAEFDVVLPADALTDVIEIDVYVPGMPGYVPPEPSEEPLWNDGQWNVGSW